MAILPLRSISSGYNSLSPGPQLLMQSCDTVIWLVIYTIVTLVELPWQHLHINFFVMDVPPTS